MLPPGKQQLIYAKTATAGGPLRCWFSHVRLEQERFQDPPPRRATCYSRTMKLKRMLATSIRSPSFNFVGPEMATPFTAGVFAPEPT